MRLDVLVAIKDIAARIFRIKMRLVVSRTEGSKRSYGVLGVPARRYSEARLMARVTRYCLQTASRVVYARDIVGHTFDNDKRTEKLLKIHRRHRGTVYLLSLFTLAYLLGTLRALLSPRLSSSLRFSFFLFFSFFLGLETRKTLRRASFVEVTAEVENVVTKFLLGSILRGPAMASVSPASKLSG